MLSGPTQKATSGNAKRLVVFLHGYGSNGEDLIGLAPFFAQIDPHCDFVSPNASERNAFNPVGFQWFPIPFIDGSSQEEMAKGLVNAQQELAIFVQDELSKRDLSYQDLVLVGFSQGTMMALEHSLNASAQVSAVICFSGRLLLSDHLDPHEINKPPIALIHGADDDVVPAQDSQSAHDRLKNLGIDVSLHFSPNTPHSIAQDGLEFALNFYAEKVLTPEN